MKTVIDFSIVYSATWHITKKYVPNPDDVDPERFYDRVMDTLIKACMDAEGTFDPGRVVICLDSGESFRKDILPDYKGTRSSKPEAFYSVRAHCYERLWEEYPDSVRTQLGLEADDLVYLEVLNNQGDCVIVSSDQDLHQICEMGLFNQYRKPVFYFDYLKHRVTETDPYFTIVEKLLRGCKGDNVPSPVIGKVFTKGIKYIADKVRTDKNITRQGIFMMASLDAEIDFELFDKVYDCVVFHNSIYKKYIPQWKLP